MTSHEDNEFGPGDADYDNLVDVYRKAVDGSKKRDWHKVSQDLQMRELKSSEIPRLLLECIRELGEQRTKHSDLLLRIRECVKEDS